MFRLFKSDSRIYKARYAVSEHISKDKEKFIVEAARKRFAHYGYSKVTMEEIATDVEMGKASLYYYFPTKENLFESVILSEQEEFIAEIKNVMTKNITASDKIHEYLDMRLEYFRQLLNLGTLNVHSFSQSRPVFRELFKGLEKIETELLNEILEDGKRSGEFRTDLPEKTVCVLVHIIQGLRLRTLKKIQDERLDDSSFQELKEEMGIMTEVFVKGMRN